MENVSSYRALALQTTCYAVNKAKTKEEAHDIINQTIALLDKQIFASIAFVRQDVKLIILPKYFLTGFPMSESTEECREKACLEIDGEIYESLTCPF